MIEAHGVPKVVLTGSQAHSSSVQHAFSVFVVLIYQLQG